MLQQWNWSDINVIEEDKIEKMYTTYYNKNVNTTSSLHNKTVTTNG